jgi:predicted dehydrogenase
MGTALRVGFAGLSHDHVWTELNHWMETPGVEIVEVADDEPHLIEQFKARIKTHNISAKSYTSWHEMLEQETLDILQIAGGNSESDEVVVAAAARGIHAVVEKPIAANLEQARRIMEAVQAAGTLLMVNWPTAWSPAWQEMERQILAGAIGELRSLRYRSAHSGPVAIGCSPSFVRDLTTPEINGAGALIDYCSYGSMLAARFIGRPEAVMGMRGVFGDEPMYAASDDNAVIVARYPHAFAVCEASWTQPVGYAGTNPVAYGSGGSIGVWKEQVMLQRSGEEQQAISPPPTTHPRRSAPEYFLHCLTTGTPIEGFCAPEVGLIAQEIMEAGLRSAESGTHQRLPLS